MCAVAVTAACYMHSAPFLPGEKITGVSLVAGRETTRRAELDHLDTLNTGWVAIIPYAFANGHVPELHFNHSRQWYGESVKGVAEQVTVAHNKGLQVMLKPHVWVKGDGWPGQFTLQTEEDWQLWEANYTAYVMSYLKVADSLNVSMFCIGTEFNQAIKRRPGFWRKLAALCRQNYSGKLTYAANWDNYMDVPCWDELDYIGVDAYFPVNEERTPAVNRIKKGWQVPKESLKKLAEKHKKRILFTEYGYRSSDFATGKHWELGGKEMPVNLEAQANAYEALYQVFWDEPWFAGGFLWKWFPDHAVAGGENNNDYTPQNKPAEQIIRKWYGRSNSALFPVVESDVTTTGK